MNKRLGWLKGLYENYQGTALISQDVNHNIYALKF